MYFFQTCSFSSIDCMQNILRNIINYVWHDKSQQALGSQAPRALHGGKAHSHTKTDPHKIHNLPPPLPARSMCIPKPHLLIEILSRRRGAVGLIPPLSALKQLKC